MDWKADEAAALDLLQRSMPGDPTRWRDASTWRWKHLENPFGNSLAMVARHDETGQIIGLRVLMAWRYLVGGLTTLAYRPVDTATDPSYRRAGIFSRMTMQALNSAVDEGAGFMFNTPNHMSVNGYLKMGWGLVAQARATIKVCNYPRFALKLVGDRLSRSNGPKDGDSTDCDDAGSVAAFLADKLAVQDLIAANATRHANRIVTDRSTSYLSWRFGNHPIYLYSAVTVGDLDGVCFFRRIKKKGLDGIILQDVILRKDDQKIMAGLVKNVQRSFAPDFMMAYAPPASFEQRALRACGFRWTANSSTNFVSNSLAKGLPLDVSKQSNWSLSICDLEFF
jgi:hypothetical protein